MMTALFALLLIAEDPTAQAAPAEAPAEAATAEKSDKKICRNDPSYTGSRMRKKLCLTQAQWDMRSQGKSAADLKTIGGR